MSREPSGRHLVRLMVAVAFTGLVLGLSASALARDRGAPRVRAMPVFDERRYTDVSASAAVFLAMTSMGERATKASPRELEHYTRLVVEACRQANVDPVFFAAILWVEAKFQHNLKSPAGACGLAQVMPTRRHSCRDLMEPAYAVRAGVANLAHWMRLHGGDALCHYNGGNVCGGGARAFERRVWAVYETMRRRVADKLRAVDET